MYQIGGAHQVGALFEGFFAFSIQMRMYAVDFCMYAAGFEIRVRRSRKTAYLLFAVDSIYAHGIAGAIHAVKNLVQ